MFNKLGGLVYKFRFAILVFFTLLLMLLGTYGRDIANKLTTTGYFDMNSASVKGADLANAAFTRDSTSDVIMVLFAPRNTLLTDKPISDQIGLALKNIFNNNQLYIDQMYSFWSAPTGLKEQMMSRDGKTAFVSIGLNGKNENEIMTNYLKIKDKLVIPGIKTAIGGQQAIAGSISDSMDKDILRAELIALPLVAVMLLFIFGGIVSAILPVIIGGLTISGALGIMRFISNYMEINLFARPVVTLIGLGIAIDYGLFIVSRFREELAAGKTTESAIRATMMTAARTIVFSAVLVVISLSCLIFFPHLFLKSLGIGAIISVSLAAFCSVTVLIAILSILGRRIDMFGFRFLKKMKTKDEVEQGFWGKLATIVMRHPRKLALLSLLVLIGFLLPVTNLKLGGISESLLPPSNSTRKAMDTFNKNFPNWRIETMKLVIKNANPAQIDQIKSEADELDGFTTKFEPQKFTTRKSNNLNVVVLQAGLIDNTTSKEALTKLRQITPPPGVEIYVSGDPALQQDSLDALKKNTPKAFLYLFIITFILMFLAFGSIILPLKAILMSVLGLGATLGVLTFLFTEGHGAELLNFTAGPLMAPVLILIIAIIYGLATDYEVFLVSRMLEARAEGQTTGNSAKKGIAHTGRIITAAAAILLVVTGAFGFSELVLMKYIAFGMIFALIFDVTIIRMLLVPAIMKLLEEDAWWAPAWAIKLINKIGLAEFSVSRPTALEKYKARKMVNQSKNITPIVAKTVVNANKSSDMNLSEINKDSTINSADILESDNSSDHSKADNVTSVTTTDSIMPIVNTNEYTGLIKKPLIEKSIEENENEIASTSKNITPESGKHANYNSPNAVNVMDLIRREKALKSNKKDP